MQENFECPQVREYLDYRKFLRDFFNYKKQSSNEYSYRVFARVADISSPSHLKMVMDGKRNLTHSTVSKYKKAIGFNVSQESYFFDLLVSYNQELDHDKKVAIFNEIIKEKKKSGLSVLEKDQFNFLSQWHYVAIYVLVDLENFKNDSDWIASKLRKKVSKPNIEKAINDLIRIGLLEYDSEKGVRQSKGALDTPEEIQSMSVVPYHRNMINLALQYLEDGQWQRREYNGGTLPMNEKTLKILKEKMREFRREVNTMTESLDGVEDVYQFNIQLFPLTEKQQ